MTTIHVYGRGLLRGLSEQSHTKLESFDIVELADEDAFVAALPGIEILYGHAMPGGHWESATNLKFIQLPGAGVDSLVPAPGLADDVIIANASGVHEPHMPEFVMAQLLALAYQVPRTVRRQDAHEWKTSFPVMSLSGRTMCVVGLGVIGQSVARRARAFGMNVTGVRRSGEALEGIDVVVTPDRCAEALAGADVAVVITPLTSETRGLIGAGELSAMNPGSLLVDVSRGGVSDIDAVVSCLESGQLAGASVDVFEPEPLPADSALWDVSNLLVTPHSAGIASNYVESLIKVLFTNVEAFVRGERPPTQVDRSLGY